MDIRPRLTEAATMHIASTNHQCLPGSPEKSQIGDKGYVGKRMITPIRKPEFRDLRTGRRSLILR